MTYHDRGLRQWVANILPSAGIAIALLALLLSRDTARGQIINGFGFGGAPGVYLDVDGNVRVRETDEKDVLAAMRNRARAALDAAKKEHLGYVSLPRLFEQVRTLKQGNQPIPEELRFLSGLMQIRYVFVFPEEKDIIIAGPAEPWSIVHGQGDAIDFAIGKKTGRPILQLDDLIVGLRTARDGGGKVFGCGIYPSPDSMKIADDIARRMARNPRAERMAAMRDGLGPQTVKIFGAPNDTRFAYICVAADYEMKRFALGIDRAPNANLGSAMDNTRSAINKFWFVSNYEPLRVSKDGNSFEIRGQRLGLECGAFDFDPRGATETARRWAAGFARSMPALATAEPLFAELQNISDEALLGHLLLQDRLAEKVGWDNAWIYDNATCPVARIPVPKTAETLVAFTSGSVVAGGVTLSIAPQIDPSRRQTDDDGTLDAARVQVPKMP